MPTTPPASSVAMAAIWLVLALSVSVRRVGSKVRWKVSLTHATTVLARSGMERASAAIWEKNAPPNSTSRALRKRIPPPITRPTARPRRSPRAVSSTTTGSMEMAPIQASSSVRRNWSICAKAHRPSRTRTKIAAIMSTERRSRALSKAMITGSRLRRRCRSAASLEARSGAVSMPTA